MKIAALCAAILLALVGAVNAQNATHANPRFQSDEKELVRLTHEWIDAINAKDQSKLDRLMAPDFVLRAWDGSWQAKRERWLYNLFHVIDIQAYSHSAISAQVFGEVAAVTSNWYSTAMFWICGSEGEDAGRWFPELPLFCPAESLRIQNDCCEIGFTFMIPGARPQN